MAGPRECVCHQNQCINKELVPAKLSVNNWVEYFNQKWRYSVEYPPPGQVPKETEGQNQVYFLINNLGVWIEAYPNEEGVENLDDLAEKMNYFPPDTNVSYEYIRKYILKLLEINREEAWVGLTPATRLILKTKATYGGKRIGEIILFFGKNKNSYYFIKSVLAVDPIHSPEFTNEAKELFEKFVSTFQLLEE